MIPQAISDALSGVSAAAAALPGKVPSGAVILTAADQQQITTELAAAATAIQQAGAALDALNASSTSTGGETPVAP